MEPEIVYKRRNSWGHYTVFCRYPSASVAQHKGQNKKGSRECAVDGLWCAPEWAAGRGGSQEARRTFLGIGSVLLMAMVRFISFFSCVLALQTCKYWSNAVTIFRVVKEMKLTTVEGFAQGQNSCCTNEQKLLLSCRQPPRPGSHRCPVYTWCRMAWAPPGHKGRS